MKTKRLLSILLSIVMIFSLLPHAFGQEGQEEPDRSVEGYTVSVSEPFSILDELQKAGHANPLECEHKHQKTETQEILAPTCTTPGSHLEVTSCEDCTLVLSQEIVEDPAAHDYIGEETVPATETEEGEMTYTCSRCGDTYTEPIPALNEEDKEEEETEEDEEDEEPVPFDQSKTVSGVTVRVSAPAGVFPAKSELLVDAVPDETVESVLEGERKEDEEVVSSYTFDIRVVDENGEELQPKDAQSVTVSFTLAEAADDTLETNIYHISEGAGGALEAEKLATTGSGSTVTAETGSFSLYRVETVKGASSPTRGEGDDGWIEVEDAGQLQNYFNQSSTSDNPLKIRLANFFRGDQSIFCENCSILDLNGQSSYGGSIKVAVNGALTIVDSDSEGKGSIPSLIAEGGTVNVSGGTVNESTPNAGTLNITGGTVTTLTGGYGTANISGGTVTTLHVLDGPVNISGGTVTTLNAGAGTVNISGGSVADLVVGGSPVNISDGTVAELYAYGGPVNIYGGTVTDLVDGGGPVNIYGGTVYISGRMVQPEPAVIVKAEPAAGGEVAARSQYNNSDVSASSASANPAMFVNESSKVEVTVTPAIGYELYKLTYQYEGNDPVDITADRSFGMPNASVTVTATFIERNYTVTYKVVNGTWADGTTEDKTETVASGSSPASVPTGMIASSDYTGGEWDTDPAAATITGAATFTYTFAPKPPSGTIFVNIVAPGHDLNGRTLTIAAEPSDSTDAVKAKIQDKIGLPPDRQVLFFGRKAMMDGKTLADYNAQVGQATLILSVRETLYTVTLASGDGSGGPIVLDSKDQAFFPDMGDAVNCQFAYVFDDNGCVGFYLDDDYCPDSFAPPANCVFDGWEGYSGSYYVFPSGSSEVTFTAKWKAGTTKPDYDVKFDTNVPANASTTCAGTMADQHFTYDGTKALSENGYSLPGYNFGGWNTEANGTGTPYADGARVQGLSENGGTVTLYAQWSGKPYTITYHQSNDAGSRTHEQTAYFDRPGKLDRYSDEAFGWESGETTLHGWTGLGSFFEDGEDFCNLCGEPDANGNVAGADLTAEWAQNGKIIVTVTKDGVPQSGLDRDFTLGGTNLEIPVSSSNGRYIFDPSSASTPGGSAAPLPEGNYDLRFDADGYPPASEQIVYKEDSAVSVVFDYYTVSLAKDAAFADFNEVELSGGAAVAGKPKTVVALDGDMLGLKTTVAQGYRFTGYTAVGVAPDWEDGDTSKATQMITVRGKADITAHVEPVEYSVTVEGGTADKATARPGETVTITANAAEAGYAFVQWGHVDGVDYTQADAFSTTFAMPAKDVTVKAVFKRIDLDAIKDQTYTGEEIKPIFGLSGVMLDGVDEVFPDQYELTYENNVNVGTATVTVTFKDPVTGEADSRLGTKSTTFNILSPGNCIVTFDSNGGSGNMDMQTIAIGKSTELAANTFTRDGHSFTGWNTKEDGTGTSYTDEQIVILPVGSENLALFAQWSAKGYSITATPNPTEGGTVTGAGTYNHGTTARLSATANDGYQFVNWTEGNAVVSRDAAYSFTVTGARTLVANFAPAEYSITFDTDGGDTIDPMAYTVESTDRLPTPTKTGSTFSGWKVTKADGNWTVNDMVADGTALTGNYGNVTLTAQWKQNGISVAEIPDQTYTGSAVTPTLTVTDAVTSAVLTTDDYNVSYLQNGKNVVELKNAGEYVVSVAGKGHYAGQTAETTFKINQAANPAKFENAVVTVKNTLDLSGKVSDAEGTVSYAIADALEGCSVDAVTGNFTSGEKSGECTVTVTVAGNENYLGTTGKIRVTVTDKKTGTLAVKQEGTTYGQPLPDPVHDAPAGSTVTVSYSGSGYGPTAEKPAKAGEYTVTVTAETADTIFTGTADFTIRKAESKVTLEVHSDDEVALTSTLVSINPEEAVKALLTEEEWEEYESGADVNILLYAKSMEAAAVPAEDRTVLTARADAAGARVGEWIDISLYKKVGSSPSVEIHQTGTLIYFTVEVPQDLRNTSPLVERTFYLYRAHEGTVTEIASTTGTVLQGSSNLFSTYLLAYKDKAVGGGDYYSTGERYTAVPPSNNPRTGDDSHLALWGVLGCLSAAGVILTAKKRKRRDY